MNIKIKGLIVSLLMAICVFVADAGGVKYVFYFIGDGMGMGHVNAAQYYNRMVKGDGDRLFMQQFPYAGICTTYSASHRVTDSAAAGTALATGYKTNNGMLGLSPDTLTSYNSIASVLKSEGWGVGVLSSLSADDATPAAFYAHRPKRGMRYEISCDAAESGFDFIGGANLKGMKKDNDVLSRLISNGYTLVRDTVAPAVNSADKILLLSPQDKSDIGYTIDSIPGALNLPSMTRMALHHVSGRFPDRFFLMVEAGNIDHAGHANDGGTVVKEIIAFQDAIKVAYEFYLSHPDETLIVVTADHDTGGLALDSKGDLKLIDCQTMSKERFSDYCKKLLKDGRPIGWNDMKKILTDRFGLYGAVRVNGDHNRKLKKAFERTFITRDGMDEKTLYDTFNEFTKTVFEVINYRTGFSFTTRSHSANPVPVYAIGRGAERFAGCLDNTEIPRLILELTSSEKRE